VRLKQSQLYGLLFSGFAVTSRRAHTRLKNFPCPECNKIFTRRDNLKCHYQNIHGEARGPFSCSLCGKLTKNLSSLRAHIYDYHKPKGKKSEKLRKT
jgi:KRAB domain-containing zinc finger protein